ncbi:MAG: hypothetical protein RE471_09725 [Ferroplasma sp.]|uniref:hypothetical protein n=1 Tax=Ferroplasma sp. TaxID=2591003 RepID=UPI0028166B30|nr:hypothetical protein [Ferroplasma sp.]WMT51242.1 MAG: hypothetical protein RE471_09725 [Ferroplasma sp.]
MSTRWITKKNGNESKHINIESYGTPREVEIKKIPPKPGELEKQAWGMLDNMAKITNVDKLLLQMNKYSGMLGDYSSFNSMLIEFQDPNATIVRSKNEWNYFGRTLKEDARGLSVLYPLGIPRKDMPGKVKAFIEKKREEGLDDETIDKLVQDKFNLGSTGNAYTFGTGNVYDISQTDPIPGKAKPVKEDVTTTQLYKTLKDIARKHYTVKEEPIHIGARGYTAHSGDGNGQEIVVMKIPGEDENVLHTLIHEMSHARLDHLNRKDIPYGIGEAEAELSTYLVGQHFGYNFRDESAAYMKGWLDNAKQDGHTLSNENLDRAMNNARHIIQDINAQLEIKK